MEDKISNDEKIYGHLTSGFKLREHDLVNMINEHGNDVSLNQLQQLVVPEICGKYEYELKEGKYSGFFNISKLGGGKGLFMTSQLIGYTREDPARIDRKVFQLYPIGGLKGMKGYEKPEYFIFEFDDGEGEIFRPDKSKIGRFEPLPNESFRIWLPEHYVIHHIRSTAYHPEKLEELFPHHEKDMPGKENK